MANADAWAAGWALGSKKKSKGKSRSSKDGAGKSAQSAGLGSKAAKSSSYKKGGKVKKEMHAEGHKAHHRMDRPKRARGGSVGADRHPFSSAKPVHKAAEKSMGEPD